MRTGILVAGIAVGMGLHAQPLLRTLHDDWQIHSEADGISIPAVVPGLVHTDLLAAGIIPDPFVGNNIDSVQWVEQRTWTYRCTFSVTEQEMACKAATLGFDGLDTYATIILNGQVIGNADNMFRQWRFAANGHLRAGANLLEVRFTPVAKGAEALRTRYGKVLPHDSDTSGLAPFVRKAAFSFGWDFAPRLATTGIWRPVYLELDQGGPALTASVTTKPMGQHIRVSIKPEWTNMPTSSGRMQLWWNGRLVEKRTVRNTADRTAEWTVDVSANERWWPRGSGPQRLHQLRLVATSSGHEQVVYERTIGLRTITLDQGRDTIGERFQFIINERPIFMRGCNIVPPDVFLPRGGDSAWVALVRHMADAHMNMVRVWSGGVYPPEAFFHACDTAGILVWQDLMFGYMVPAGDSAFLANAHEEVRQQVERIGAHPCLAVFCGNNELDVAWSNWGWQQRYGLHGQDSAAVRNDHLAFFHDSLARWTAPFPYTPSSPLSNWGNAAGLRNGDLHYWGVWHADSSLASYTRNVGRFMSEYGFQSYPDSTTLARYLAPEDLVLGSAALARRQLSYRTDKPLFDRIGEELGERPLTLGAFIQATQAVQAKGYGLAIDAQSMHIGQLTPAAWVPYYGS
ncbi:MAG: hypothetical protein MUE88_08760 [Flavobacteriales bacterium]|nr:hypothetical protein [Flavobacteriales bacterium]